MADKRTPNSSNPLSRAAKRAVAAERKNKAFQLKLAGMSHSQIADVLGVTKGRVGHYLKAELDQLALSTREHAHRYRSEEVARLDALQRKAWPLAMGQRHADGSTTPPDGQWFDRVVRVVELRARLLGLFAPQSIVLGASESDERIVFYVPDNGRSGPAPDWSDDESIVDADGELEQAGA